MMRTEREMTDLILSAAKRDDRIREAYLNGSRANPAAPTCAGCPAGTELARFFMPSAF